jgi:4-hydroxy-4-methyl-2-oxoglutarate aldolase
MSPREKKMTQANLSDYFSLIEYKARARINRTFARLSEAQLSKLAGTPTTFVADARTGSRATLPYFIRPLDPDSQFVGSALTVTVGVHDLFAPVAALDLLKAGDVLIIASGAIEDWAVIGGHMATLAQQRGAVAIVTDGLVRDSTEISHLIPCFCKGTIPNASFSVSSGEVGLPISIGGVHIRSGDLLVGDRDGIVHVPHAEVDFLIEKLPLIQKFEKAISDDLAARTVDTFMTEFDDYQSKILTVNKEL